MDKKIAVILNRLAGKGKAAASEGTIRDHLRELRAEHEVFITQAVGHAAELAQDVARQGYSLVVAAGGDGTCNEVINGLMAVRRAKGNVPALAVLPLGRGNDFAWGAGIPGDLTAALELLREVTPLPLDVGFVRGGDYPRGRYFGNGIGIGFDTIVGLEAAKNRYLQGAFSYVYGALRTLLIYPEAPDLVLQFNGDEYSFQSHQVSILNGRRMGGTFHMAPEATVDDGLLDLCIANKALSRREMIGLIGQYIRGTQGSSPLIMTGRTAQIEITAPRGGLVCHADGETICTNGDYLHVECEAGALQILRDPSLPARRG